MMNSDEQAKILQAVNNTINRPPLPWPAFREPGDVLSGVIVDVEQHHRSDRDGRPMYWLDRRPQVDHVTTRPVYDHALIMQVDPVHQYDLGLRRLWLDHGVQEALRDATAGAGGIEIGGRINGLGWTGLDAQGRYAYVCAQYLTVRQQQAQQQQQAQA